jgi:LPS O-antigen subunit length determinant protein (WzzB/FepE family)
MNPVSVVHLLKSISNLRTKQLLLEKLSKYDCNKNHVFLYYYDNEIRYKFIY